LIHRFQNGSWEGFEILAYKDTPGSHEGVVRQNLLKEAPTDYEIRYFEVAPGGYTSFERHEHEHFVVVVAGSGEVRLGDEVAIIGERDIVRVSGNVPHQFRNKSSEPLGILCVVDRVRDRPQLMEPAGAAGTSNIKP
jgi:quercetin dioxygenase-like cupin family protein